MLKLRKYQFQQLLGKKVPAIAFAVVIAITGATLAFMSRAATPTASVEPESGSKSGVNVIADVTASGGSAVQFSDKTAVADDGRFFQMPNLSGSSKLVFAHYFLYPIRYANEDASNDYYARNYLRATGESSAHVAYGGFLRNRPMPVPISGTNWKAEDNARDIEWAIDAGIDGFYVDIMGGPGSQSFEQYKTLRDVAAAQYPNFYVIPELDATASLSLNGTITEIAAAIAAFSSTSQRLSDNRMVVAAFATDRRTPAWWSSVTNALISNHGITPAWHNVFLDYSQAGNYTQYASGQWGAGADPNIFKTHGDYAGQAHARGEKYIADIWNQDIRPKNSLFDEARGTKALMAAWDRANADNAEIAQLATWQDYSEGSEFRPSPARGMVPLDLSAWRITQFKTGTSAPILKDGVYLAHRNQMAASTIAGPQTSFMTHWARSNRSAFQEKVEVLTFLTTPASVTVTVGGVPTTYAAPAGMFSQEVDARYGGVSVTISRSGNTAASLTSPFQIRSTVWQQDRQYYMSSSLRGTTGQFDPTETDTGQKPTYPL